MSIYVCRFVTVIGAFEPDSAWVPNGYKYCIFIQILHLLLEQSVMKHFFFRSQHFGVSLSRVPSIPKLTVELTLFI